MEHIKYEIWEPTSPNTEPAYSFYIGNDDKKDKSKQAYYLVGSYKSLGTDGKVLLAIHIPDVNHTSTVNEYLQEININQLIKDGSCLEYDCSKKEIEIFSDVDVIILLQIIEQSGNIPYKLSSVICLHEKGIKKYSDLFGFIDTSLINNIPQWKYATCLKLLTPYHLFNVIVPTLMHSELVETEPVIYCHDIGQQKEKLLNKWYDGELVGSVSIYHHIHELVELFRIAINNNEKINELINSLVVEKGILLIK